MAHPAQMQFFQLVKSRFPLRFTDTLVLDVGSLDINGNNRGLFFNSNYIGIDLAPGRNVNIVRSGHLYNPMFQFDVIISGECFEHDKHYALTLKNIFKLLRTGGLFTFTCATTGRAEHGTTKRAPKDSPFTLDYYKNLTEADIREVLDMDGFKDYKFIVNNRRHDLYFWGIKK